MFTKSDGCAYKFRYVTNLDINLFCCTAQSGHAPSANLLTNAKQSNADALALPHTRNEQILLTHIINATFPQNLDAHLGEEAGRLTHEPTHSASFGLRLVCEFTSFSQVSSSPCETEVEPAE